MNIYTFFAKYQRLLVWLFNRKIMRWWIKRHYFTNELPEKISEIYPAAYSQIIDKYYSCDSCVKKNYRRPELAKNCKHKRKELFIRRVSGFFSLPKFYYAVKPFIKLLHLFGFFFDEEARLIPKFGNTVSTFSSQTSEGGANVTQDGSLSGQEGVAWATTREGGTPGDAGSANLTERLRIDEISNSDFRLHRIYMSFNTGPTIDDGATVNDTADTKLTARIVTEKVGWGTGNDGVVMVGTSMAAPATLGTADWLKIKAAGGGDFGTGAMEENSDRVNPPGVGNDMTMDINAAGIANISKTGISQFALVSVYDAADVEPVITEHSLFINAADNGTNIPVLSVDWSTAGAAVPFIPQMLLLGIG